MVLHSYWITRCVESRALKAQGTTGKERRIKRWEHEDVLDAMQHRLDRAPCASDGRPSNTHSERSKPGWVRRTSS